MAVNDPTEFFLWPLPDVGGDVGAWGGMLRAIFGEDGTGGPLGIDGVLKSVQDTANAALPATGGTVTGDLVLENDSGPRRLDITTPESSSASVEFQTASSARWRLRKEAATQDFLVERFDDTGAVLGESLKVLRSSGEVITEGDLTVGGVLGVGSLAGNGSGLTNLNASNIDTGTLDNNRLPPIVNVVALRGDAGSAANTTYGLDGAVGNGLYFSGSDPTVARGGVDKLQITLSAIQALGGATFTGNGSGLTNLNASNLSSGTVPLARVPNLPASQVTSGSFASARLGGSYTDIDQLATSGLAAVENLRVDPLGTQLNRVLVFQFTFSGNPGLPPGNVTNQIFTAPNVTTSSKLVATINNATSSQFIVTRAIPGSGQITVHIHNGGSTTIDPDGTTVTVVAIES